MSHKGAIRKVSTTKDVHQSSSKSKSKGPSSAKESESSEKLEPKSEKKSEQMIDDSRHSRLMQNVQSSKSGTRQSIRASKTKSVRESSSTSKLKSDSSKTPVTSKVISDHGKKPSSSNLVKTSKSSTGRIQSNYSEKRGLSTVYVPPSLTTKLNIKSASRDSKSVSKEEQKTKVNSNPKRENNSTLKSRQRKLSRTLSPSEVKMLHSATNRANSLQRDQNLKNQPVAHQINSVDDYEDDFEDYESDFQECTDSDASEVSEETSSHSNSPLDPIELLTSKQRKVVNSAEQKEEEHMHDSGHYELTEARKRAARIESVANDPKLSSLLELRQPVNKTYSESETKSLPSSTDEGFEDSRSGDFTKSPPLPQISFIDFRKTKKTQRTKKFKKRLSRGEELLEMIKLDVMEWSLLECSPVPYEEFIRSYGKLNAQQMSTQTGEDNIDVEIQTDKIVFTNKWTQFPITCRSNLRTKEDLDLFRMDQNGVGNDDDLDSIKSLTPPSFDILRLSDFLNRAGRVILSLMEERRSGGNVFKNVEDVPFSDGVVKLSVNSVTFLSGRAVTLIHYSSILSKILLTIHSPAEEEIETSSKQDYITDCCIGCVWNISEPSMPVKLFYSPSPITACSFHLTSHSVVFAGLQDGSISLWDLKEDEMWHQKVTDKANELDWTIRMPTYTTTGNTDINVDNSQIVALRVLSKIEEKSFQRRNNKFVPIQICSLSEKGSLIIWSVLHSMGINVDDLGLSYWGSIRLVKSQELLLQSHILRKRIGAAAFIDMHVDCVDNNNVYVVTNSNNVLHATCIGNKASPSMYTKFDTSSCGNVTCIEICPFEYSFFLVGCDDGTIRLHSLNIEKPILQLRDEDNTYSIKSVQWSKTKPFTIFVLDNKSRIHIWDLNSSDIYPTHTINVQKCGSVNCVQLSSCKTERDMTHQYLAFGTESGNVEIHKLKPNFCYSKKEDYLQESNNFMRYVAIL
ncbi:PREDICTED: WD repeat-containing protein 60 [Dufourea novaeangliae]|uniref:WD repeat-containing protein 60 n=1 Tax=Dufourea novaeangliae TaxID=178035 RepID=UPI0007670889|nr:PREDICTED: WD repeat-containing protein 60 [Dufourea novaeangliae]